VVARLESILHLHYGSFKSLIDNNLIPNTGQKLY
jgi:hypothetical protein